MVLDLETEKALWALDVAVGAKTIRTPAEKVECFVRLTNVIKLFSLPRDILSDWSKYIVDHAAKLPKSYYAVLAKRKEIMEEMLTWDKNAVDSLPKSLKQDLIDSNIFDFEPENRQKLLTIVQHIMEGGAPNFFRFSAFSSLPMVWLKRSGNLLLVSAEPFMLDGKTVDEFDGSRKDVGELLSRIFLVALYAKKKNLFSKDELVRDQFALNTSREIAKSFMKHVKESEQNLKIGSLFSEGEFWEATMLMAKNKNMFRSLKHGGKCTLIELGAAGRMSFTSFSTNCGFNFDTTSLKRVADAKSSDQRGSLVFLSSAYSLFYGIQQFFVGNYELDEEFDPHISSKLMPLEIMSDCIFDTGHYENNPREFVGLKNLLVKFKGNTALEIGKAESDFTVPDRMMHSIMFAMTTAQGSALRADFYFMPSVLHMLHEIKAAGEANATAVDRTNSKYGMFGKQWKFVETSKEKKIVGHFTDKLTIAQNPKVRK